MKKKEIKVLLIEDNPGDVRLIREMLSEATDVFLKLECADRLNQGLKRLSEGGLDLILLDLGLPDSQGLDTFIKAHTQARKVPIVVLTGLDDEKIGLSAVQNGAQDYLVKGKIDGNILTRTIRYAIERMRAKEALRESEARYRSLTDDVIDTSMIGIFILDKNFRIAWVNRALEQFFGMRREKVIGQDKRQLIRGKIKHIFEDSKGFEQRVVATYDDNTYIEKFECHVLPDIKRKERWLEHWSQPIRSGLYAGGRIEHYSDITERKQAEDKIKDIKERYERILDNADEAIFRVDAKGGYVIYANPAAERMVGYSLEEWLDDRTLGLKIIHPDFAEKQKQIIEEINNSKKTIKNAVLGWIAKDGKKIIVEYTIIPITDENGKVVYFESIGRDITDRTKAEEVLKESVEKYRTIIDNIEEGYYEVDFAGNFTFFNDSLCRMLECSKDELMGMNNRQYMDEKSAKKIFQIFNKVYKKGEPCKAVDFQIIRKDGVRKFGEISVSLMKDSRNQPIGFRGIVHDITERKQEETIRNVLFNISKAAAKTGSLDDLLATIHEQTGTLMDAKNFFVCLTHDIEKNLYTFPYYKDINPEDIIDPSEILEITKGLTHHVLKTKKYLLGNREELKKIGVIGTVPESWLGVPLKTERGDVTGVIAVQSYEKETYSEKDAQVLSIIASNITGALKYKKAEEQIRASLREKEVLLQEIHHRVKNNMQIISSLIKLQSRHIKDEKALETFMSTQDRVKSMALIHERLYRSKDFARVDFAEYVRSLTAHLFSAYGIDPRSTKLKTDIKDIFLDINTAIPCGLIINELVSNSLKHAFPNGKKGEINISMHPSNKNEVELIVSDNGVGLPKDIDIRKTESLGLHLVTILAEDQLHGKIKLDRTKGTSFQIKLRVKQ